MKTASYILFGVSHKAVKVATCTSNGVYKNYAEHSKKGNGTANKMLRLHNNNNILK